MMFLSIPRHAVRRLVELALYTLCSRDIANTILCHYSNLIHFMFRLTLSTGPDHLAALLPKCCGQKWYRAGRIGALWGMGHGVSATILGLTAFGLKNRISSMPGIKGALIGASSAMEVAVGASLIFIGLIDTLIHL